MKFEKAKVLSILIKAVFLLLSIYYVSTSLFSNNNNFSTATISSLETVDIVILGFVVLLMPINWGLESIKWKILLNGLQDISYLNAFVSVLGGIAISLGMPNRTGEFVGRVLFLRKDNRLSGSVKSIIGSTIQLFVTLIFGLFSLIFLKFNYQVEFSNFIQIENYQIILTISFLILLLLLLLLANKYSNRFPKLKELWAAFSMIDLKTVLLICVLSLFRYMVFVFQYLLLLQVFDIQIGLILSLALISVVFLITSIIPSFFLTEAVTRTAISVLIFQPFTGNSLGITSVSLILWVINIVLPGLVGWLFVIGKREKEKVLAN